MKGLVVKQLTCGFVACALAFGVVGCDNASAPPRSSAPTAPQQEMMDAMKANGEATMERQKAEAAKEKDKPAATEEKK